MDSPLLPVPVVLSAEIILDILSRLPAESVLECKRVCKTWRQLLQINDDTYFSDMHLQRSCGSLHQQVHAHYEYCYTNSIIADTAAAAAAVAVAASANNNNNNKVGATDATPTKGSFLFFPRENMERYGEQEQLYYGVCDEDDEKKSYKTTLTKIKSPPLHMDRFTVGSCNGLICFFKTRFTSYSYSDPVYIYNPITREYARLPRFIRNNEYKSVEIVHGFGYHPSSNEYKVVRIYYYASDSPSFGQVQVYTLGSGGSRWRNKGEITYSLEPRKHQTKGIFANGALHWFDKDGKIVAFDLADEKFHLLPSPTSLPACFPGLWFYNFKLCVLGGLLCLLVYQSDNRSVDIWSLNKKGISSCDMKEHEYQSWSWSKKFVIKTEEFNQSGEIILWDIAWSTLIHYNPKTATLKDLWGLTAVLDRVRNYEVVSHVNSFVSLKALGEDAKILGDS